VTGSHAGYRRHGTAQDLRQETLEHLAWLVDDLLSYVEGPKDESDSAAPDLRGEIAVGIRDGVLRADEVEHHLERFAAACVDLEQARDKLCSVIAGACGRAIRRAGRDA